jgi:hypothetical protein
MLVLLVVALLLVIAALGAGWLLAIWLVVKRPIIGVPIVVYVGLVMWLGAHDAQALAIYAVIVLVAWRLAHNAPSSAWSVGACAARGGGCGYMTAAGERPRCCQAWGRPSGSNGTRTHAKPIRRRRVAVDAGQQRARAAA